MPDNGGNDFWSRANSSKNVHKPQAPNKYGEDKSGLFGSASQSGMEIPKRYAKISERLGWSPYETPQDMEREAYANQSGSEVFFNTVKGFGTQALAGVIDSVAAYDMQGLYDMSVGNTEKQYGNWLNEIGKNLREYSENEHPIYQDGDSMWNAAYWAKQGQSLGYTGGIIAETIAEQVALGYLTGGTANELGLASKARLFKTLGQGAHGMWKGVQEGYMNALETQQNVYNKYKELGYSEDVAQKKANEAASLGFRAEVGPLAALNALQFMTTFGVAKSAFNRAGGISQGFSGGIETLADRILPEVSSKWGKAGLAFGVNALSEGVEEGIQTGIGKYAMHETLKSTGDASGDLHLWDEEMRDSIVGGILGGGLFAGAGSILNKYTQGTAAKQYSRLHDNFLSEAVSRTSNAFEEQQRIQQDYNTALETYNKDKSKANFSKLQEQSTKVKEAQYNSHLANTVNALQLDYINSKTTAFESHIDQMQTLLDAANNGDIETLKAYNIIGQDNKEKFEGAIDTIKNTFEQNIKDSELIKSSLENNLLNVTSDFEAAFDITKKEYMNSKQLESVNALQTDLEGLYSRDNQFKQLSPEAQQRFKLEAELESLNRLEMLTDINKERRAEIQESLNSVDKYKSSDRIIVDSISKNPYVNGYTSIASTLQAVEDNNKQLKDLRDISKIREKIKERNNSRIQNAQTSEEVEAVVDEARNQGMATPEMETLAENKQSEIAAQETIQEANPEFIPNDNLPEDKPLENSQEQQESDTEGLSLLEQMMNSGAITSSGQNFSPREFDSSKLDQTQIDKLAELYSTTASKLDKKLNKTADFKDFIGSQIEQFGYDRVDSSFEGLKFAWDNIGRDVSKAQEIYDSLFNTDELGLDLLESGFVSNEELDIKTDEVVEDTIVDNSKTVTYDKDNRPVDKEGNYTLRDGRTANPTPKASFLGIQYVEVKNADGTYSKQPVLAQLNQSEQITNHFVLDADKIKAGTELEVIIPDDVDNIKVADWNYNDSENRWEKSEITFGAWAKKNKAIPGTDKYNNKVPMIATFSSYPSTYFNKERADIERRRQEDLRNTSSTVDKNKINPFVSSGSGEGHFALYKNNNSDYDNRQSENIDKLSLIVYPDKTVVFKMPYNGLDVRRGSTLGIAIQGYNYESIDQNSVRKLLDILSNKLRSVKDSDNKRSEIEKIFKEVIEDFSINISIDKSLINEKYDREILKLSQNNDKVFFLHDAEWYNTSNVTGMDRDAQKNNIKLGIENIKAVRSNILSGNTRIRIDDRNFGSLFKLNSLDKNTPPISLSEATGETKLAIASTYNELVDSTSSHSGTVNSRMRIVNNLDKNKFDLGVTYELRHVNTTKDGEKLYLALPALTNDVSKGELLNDTAYNNVKFSLISSVILNSKNNPAILSEMETKYGMTLSKAEGIRDSIRTTTGLDITYEIGDYMSMFTQVDTQTSKMLSKLENRDLNTEGNLKFPMDTNYISVDNNVVKIAIKDNNEIPRNAKGFDNLPGINLNNITEASLPAISRILEDNFAGNDGGFRKTKFDISKKQLNRNKPFTVISDNGSVSEYDSNKHGENTYEGYIKDNLKTNVKSFPITDIEGNTKWVTDVQPMIYYSTVVGENIKPEITQEDRTPVVTNTPQDALNTVEKASDELSEQAGQDLSGAIDALPDDLKAQLGKFKLPGQEDEEFFSQRELGTQVSKDLDNIETNQISTLSPIEQKKLTNSLFNLILGDTRINNGMVSLLDIATRIENSVETYLQPKIDELVEYSGNLKKLGDPKVQPLIDNFDSQIAKLQSVVANKEKIVSNGRTAPKGDLVKKFERFLAEELTVSEDMIENEDGEVDVEFNYSMSSLEKDVKLTFSNNLKIFFANIKKQNPRTREDITNFSYLNDFVDIDDVIQALTEVMVGLPSSIEDLVNILETKKENPIYNQILNKIKSSSEEIQNEILYKMIQSKLDMQMVLYSFNRDTQSYSLKIINPNSNSSDVRLRQQWVTDFINSDLFTTKEEQRVYDKEAVNGLIEKINNLGKIDKLTLDNKAQVKDVFDLLGINISDNTLNRLIETEGNNILTSKGVLGVFKSNLQNILQRNKTLENITLDDENNNPYNNSVGVIDNLIDLELDTNGTRVSKSFRVGSKSIQGAIQKMMVYDVKEQLKDTESPLFKALEVIPYSKRNYILQLMKSIPKFKDNYDVSFVSLESIKQVKQKVYDDRKINKLAVTDNMLTQYAFFTNTVRELGEVLPDTDLNFRVAHMFNPSLSDKEQMVLYSTAVADLTFKNFTLKTDGTVELNDSILDFMTEQIYASEFDRIVNTYQNPTNIKNYDGAAKRFLSIPELNNIKSKEGASIHTVIAQASHDMNTIDSLREVFRPQAKDIIRETLRKELTNKIDVKTNRGSWIENGFVTPDEKNNYDISFFDARYMERKKGKNTGISNKHLSQMMAYDFIVNQFLNQNNTYQLIAGDMALYAPSIKKFTNKTTKEIDNVAFSKAVGESITKRMAMLIAPGNKLANSKNDKYMQIFVNDPIKMTSTAREFIKQYYGSVSQENNDLLQSLSQIENNIQNLYKSGRTNEKFDERLEELEDARANTLKKLSDLNQEIGGYFDIEGTDAQEYTTWKEHMDILFRQGRLTNEEKALLQSAYNKLESGQDLETSELAVVMNPIKPVYAGNNIFRDKSGNPNVNRIVYIKSSSFPLLPQLTKDFKLDGIRTQMEELQARTGKNVRLSYQTANKVGAVSTKLTTNDLYNIPFTELYNDGKGKLAQSVLELDRDNFKIQQDTPYKTAKFLKKNSDDMTTMGSQMWKIILGNNINKIDRKIFPNLFGNDLIKTINSTLPMEEHVVPENGMLSGRDLDKIKFHSERMYFDIQREMLYDELGIDRETRQPYDRNETVKLLNSLLQREVTTRQYPEGIVDNLELVTDDRGNLQFVLPMWLSTASNKFESLLQAVITNRLIQINLPGNQHISASSEGFEKKSLEDLDSNIKSQVVWVNPNHTGELKTTIVDGKVKESEILVQSKFRKTYKDASGKIKTKLVDLTKAPYSRMENGVLVLNEGMIDDELLTNFSFRIPTSSHQSGAILKVVGFLPEASGDMVVVPKEHTKQIGEDFDIDKRTLYKSNYEIDESGKISKLNYSETNNNLEKLTYALLGVDYQEYLGTEEGKTKRASLQAKTKMLENAMVDIYKSVYLSPTDEIQKKINKILSFDNATDTANLINSRINSTTDDRYFSIYSDDYQRAQMKLGADGKTGIGGHSNAVTLQAQMERLENKIEVRVPISDENGEIIGYAPSNVTIGSFTSDGVLGRIETLDGERTIGDIHTENQNSATDNIKAQIMGKRNENPYTMNVLIQLTFRGFDMAPFTPRVSGQPNKIQISSVFISQPILRRYVELKEQNKSITTDFDANSENNILRKLVQEFGDDKLKSQTVLDPFNLMDAASYQKASEKMTGNRLYDNLINEVDQKTWESDIQIAVLQKFFRLTEEAKSVSEYQSLINLSTTGLGVSFFNVLDRIEVLNKLGYEEQFANIKDLVGDFIEIGSPQDTGDLVNSGYTQLGNFFIKPTTTEGTVLVNSLSSAYDVMKQEYFTYTEESVFGNVMSKILNIRTVDKDLSKKAKMDFQYRVIGAMRDFIYSSPGLGLFSGNIDTERRRLFFDTKDNQSLASFLRDLKITKRNPLMYTNELLKSFSFDGIKTDGSPSLIKHQTDFNTNFDKTDKYNSFLELLQDNKTVLGTFNGVTMTPRLLAQDLASYAFLSNNENGAIGFRDFINVKYLNIIGTSERVRNISSGAINADVFEQQFFQHNPEEAKIFSDSNVNIEDFVQVNSEANKARNEAKADAGKATEKLSINRFLGQLTSFTLKDNRYKYISMRDTSIKKSDNQYRLFKWNGDKYVRIPVLGTFGFNEYNPDNIAQNSLMYPEVTMDTTQDNLEILPDNINLAEVLDLSKGVKSLLEQIYNDSSDTKYREFANELLPYIDTNTKVEVTNDVNTGKYNRDTNTITLGSNMINYLSNTTGENVMGIVEEVVLEEIIHSMTVNQLNQFGTNNTVTGIFTPNSDAPAFVHKLAKLHEVAKAQLPGEYYTQDIYEFIAGAFVSNEFKGKLDNTVVSGKSLYEQFKDAIAAMVRYLTGSSYSSETVKSVYELLNYKNNISTEANTSSTIESMKKGDLDIDVQIDNLQGLLDSGIFSSGGPEDFSSREVRLPEIKCKR